MRFAARISEIFMPMTEMPAQSLESTAVGAFSSVIAVHATIQRWLSYVRRLSMRPRIYIAVLVLLSVIWLSLVAHVSSISYDVPRASFSFLGYTNDSSGRRLAIVTIINEDRYPIRFVSVGAYVWFDSTNTPIGADVLPSLEGTDLPPGKSRTFCLIPANVEMPSSDVKRAVEIWVRRDTVTENLELSLHRLYWRIPEPSVYGLRSPFIIQ